MLTLHSRFNLIYSGPIVLTKYVLCTFITRLEQIKCIWEDNDGTEKLSFFIVQYYTVILLWTKKDLLDFLILRFTTLHFTGVCLETLEPHVCPVRLEYVYGLLSLRIQSRSRGH
jgi:hypothetical protein